MFGTFGLRVVLALVLILVALDLFGLWLWSGFWLLGFGGLFGCLVLVGGRWWLCLGCWQAVGLFWFVLLVGVLYLVAMDFSFHWLGFVLVCVWRFDLLIC